MFHVKLDRRHTTDTRVDGAGEAVRRTRDHTVYRVASLVEAQRIAAHERGERRRGPYAVVA